MATGFHFMSTGDGQGVEDRDCLGSVETVRPASLSYCHKCTQGGDDSGPSSSWRDDREAGAHDVTFWGGGSLVEVHEVKSDGDGIARASALRGALRTRTHPGYRVKDDQVAGAAAKRGKVTKFSDKSRRRLHLLLGKVDASASCLFLTLTISDGPAHDGPAMKMYLKRFKVRLTRKFPNVAMVWRLECVPRKSGVFVGQAVGHFHGLLWGVPDAPGLREWIGEAWSACVGDVSRTRIETPRSSKAVQGYCAKLYLSKAGDDRMIEDVGRMWGVLQDDRIPWAVALTRRLTYGETVKMLRVFRRWIKAGRRSRGRRGRVPYLVRWRAFFVSDPAYWADRLGGIIGDQDDPAGLLSGIGRAVEVRTL